MLRSLHIAHSSPHSSLHSPECISRGEGETETSLHIDIACSLDAVPGCVTYYLLYDYLLSILSLYIYMIMIIYYDRLCVMIYISTLQLTRHNILF